MPIICRICFSIYMFFHMTHIGSPCGRADKRACLRAAAARAARARARGPIPHITRVYAKRARRAFRQAGPPILSRLWPSARRGLRGAYAMDALGVARYSFASCTPLSLNTGVHTTHNARRIFEAIIWRYVRSARFFKVPPSLQTTAFEPKTLSSTLGYPFADFTPTASRRYVSKLLNDAPG